MVRRHHRYHKVVGSSPISLLVQQQDREQHCDKVIVLAPLEVSSILRLGQHELLVAARSVPVGEMTLQAIPLISCLREKRSSTHPTLLRLRWSLAC